MYSILFDTTTDILVNADTATSAQLPRRRRRELIPDVPALVIHTYYAKNAGEDPDSCGVKTPNKDMGIKQRKLQLVHPLC